ncbi:YbaN family protein [Lampropedia aestuarii]|nr:YbaN family protein [Lampropedia aestuarii]MDH5858760.1 YbaN family protein [Lampropedia aestuarii]
MTAKSSQTSPSNDTPAAPSLTGQDGPARCPLAVQLQAQAQDAQPQLRMSQPRRCPSLLGRVCLYILAICSLGMGIVGVFVPGLPTTVFVLIAAWAAARSSPKLHNWLLQHTLFGPILRNWEAGGFVSAKAKRAAILTMLISVLVMLLAGVPHWALLLASGCMACVAVYLWRRPEPPAQE